VAGYIGLKHKVEEVCILIWFFGLKVHLHLARWRNYWRRPPSRVI
jgi:hypothetical protein